MTLLDRWNYHGSLALQLPAPPVRLLYAASGTLPAAAILKDAEAVVEHNLYWAAMSEDEAYYLAATLNSETSRLRVAHMQSRGQWGARHFDKLMFELPIPAFDAAQPLHAVLVAAAKEAEVVAADVPLDQAHFVAIRRRIRAALRDAGTSGAIDALVGELLG